MWVVVYRTTGAGGAREERSSVFPTRVQAKEHATALLQQHDVLRIELAGFQIGQSYERRDGRTAIVTEVGPTGQSARIRFASGDTEWITWADICAHWRLYENCPTCHGIGQIAVVQPVRRDHSKPQNPPTCPICKGAARIYPVPNIAD